MNLACRIYVSRQEFETQEAVVDIKNALGSRLSSLLNNEIIAGYAVTILSETDDFDEEDIDREIVESVTAGHLPAIYVNVTYDIDEHDAHSEEAASLLLGSGMVLAFSYPAQAAWAVFPCTAPP